MRKVPTLLDLLDVRVNQVINKVITTIILTFFVLSVVTVLCAVTSQREGIIVSESGVHVPVVCGIALELGSLSRLPTVSYTHLTLPTTPYV